MLAITPANLSLRRSSEPLQVKDEPPHAGAPNQAGSKEFDLALGSRAAPALELLDLSYNKIGDEGLRHLADALARGAAPALKWLYLSGNPASGAAGKAVEDARHGLETIDLDRA